jgi:Ni,Fe-hydrogenase III large subunit
VWDSCFILDFSHVHAVNSRHATKSRFRQWMTHKLAAWIDRFGRPGCVGCGRCRAAPYAAYAEMEFDSPVQQDGDVRARLLVRALEIMESCRILHQALAKMPPGEINTGDAKFAFITGTATSRVEAPRGEVFYSVTWKEGSRYPSRVHVRTPTYVNMPAVRYMVRGARLADAPLIQASIDPCYSCTDR